MTPRLPTNNRLQLRPYGDIQICLLLLLFYFILLTPILNSQGMKKLRYAMQKSTKRKLDCWNKPYSSPSFTKQSSSKLALYRWIRTESRWNKKLISLSSSSSSLLLYCHHPSRARVQTSNRLLDGSQAEYESSRDPGDRAPDNGRVPGGGGTTTRTTVRWGRDLVRRRPAPVASQLALAPAVVVGKIHSTTGSGPTRLGRAAGPIRSPSGQLHNVAHKLTAWFSLTSRPLQATWNSVFCNCLASFRRELDTCIHRPAYYANHLWQQISSCGVFATVAGTF